MTRHGRVPPGARAARLSLRHRLPGWMRLARRVVRSRTLIVAEALGLAAVLALFTAVPQVGAGNPAGLRRLLDEYPRWAAILHGAGLDAILHTRWFLGLIALCTATLWLVLEDQWSRAIRLWRQRLTPESFRNAPYRHEVWRGLPSGERGAPRIEIDTRGRLGLFGT